MSRIPLLSQDASEAKDTVESMLGGARISSELARIVASRYFGGIIGGNLGTTELLDTVLFFKKTKLFEAVPAEKLVGLAEISRLVSYKKGTEISREGDISDQLFVVKSGNLSVVKTKNGVRTVLARAQSGEAYGETGLFSQSPRSASAEACEDCMIYVIQRSALKKLIHETSELALNFLGIFSEKLQKTNEDFVNLNIKLHERSSSASRDENKKSAEN